MYFTQKLILDSPMSKSRPKELFSSVITVGSLLCPISSPSRMHIGASPFALDSEKHAGLSSNQVQCRDFETVKDGREEHSATENFPVDPITSVVQASPDVLASHRLNGAHRAVSSSVVPVQTVFKRLERDLDINCNDILAANCPILFSRSNIMKCSSPKVNVITSLPTLQPDYAFAV